MMKAKERLLMEMLYLNNKRLVWIIGTIMVLLACGNILLAMDWKNQPRADNGILDLRGWEGIGHEVVKLKGAWEFYPGQLLTAESKPISAPVLIQSPGNWSKGVSNVLHNGALGYGTYRLQIKLDHNEAGPQAFLVPLIRSAHHLYVDNELIGENGLMAEVADQYSGQSKPYVAYKEVQHDTIDLFLQVANFDHATSGGMIQPISMGPLNQISREQQRIASFEFGIIVIFVLFALFFGVMHIQARSNGWIYLTLFFLCSVLVTAVQGFRWLLWVWPDLSMRSLICIHWLGSIGIIIGLFLFVCNRHANHINLPIKRSLLTLLGVIAFCVLCLPIHLVTRFLLVWLVVSICTYGYVLFVLLRSLQSGDRQSRYEFSAFYLFSALAFLNMFRLLGFSVSDEWYYFQVFGFSLAISLLILLQFFQAYRKMKALSLELKRMDRFKNEFMSGISEQMVAPLQAIISIANARLHADDSLTTSQSYDLRLITSISWSTGNLVGDLRDFSKIREEITLQLRAVDLYSVMGEAIERFSYLPFNEPITLSNDIPPTISPIFVDEQRFNQILTNLLRHAIKMIRDGSISVLAFMRGELVEIRFMMRGTGFTEENRIQLTQALNQEERDLQTLQNSPFQGLYLVKELVALHNGVVSVRSESDQEVSVYLTLPIAADDVPIKSSIDGTEGNSTVSGNGTSGFSQIGTNERYEHLSIRNLAWNEERLEAHILLIDGDAFNVKVMLTLLTLDHYRVTVVRDGTEALSMLHQMRQIDLVIVDRTLPERSGLEVCRRIREQYTLFELPILLLTSGGYPDHAIVASEAGANDFLKKPIESSELRVRVRTLLHLKRSVMERIRMELAFLQAQIKPHFLFNTLNSIAALSKSQPKKMTDLMSDFGHYLRESFRFDNSEPLIPFEREMRLVKSYLNIEKVRFEDYLTFHIEVSIDTFRIPPLTIQPLVENAVRHGIMRKAGGGQVLLQVFRDEQDIRIVIKDNGVGMTPEELERLQHFPSSGVGIQNIERRLKQLFGYGLTIHSEPGQGTEIQIRLPIEKVGFNESNIS